MESLERENAWDAALSPSRSKPDAASTSGTCKVQPLMPRASLLIRTRASQCASVYKEDCCSAMVVEEPAFRCCACAEAAPLRSRATAAPSLVQSSEPGFPPEPALGGSRSGSSRAASGSGPALNDTCVKRRRTHTHSSCPDSCEFVSPIHRLPFLALPTSC